MPPEAEIQPDCYDVASEAWSFGKTILEVFQWRCEPRAKLLMGSVVRDSNVSEMPWATVKTLLNQDPRQRITVQESQQNLRWYRSFCEEAKLLDRANYEEAINAVLAFRREVFPEHFDKDKALANASIRRINPEDFGIKKIGSPSTCPRCGSPFVVLLTVEDGTPAEDYCAYFVFYYVCLGLPGQACGNLWAEAPKA
jgi:hypothetical protein